MGFHTFVKPLSPKVSTQQQGRKVLTTHRETTQSATPRLAFETGFQPSAVYCLNSYGRLTAMKKKRGGMTGERGWDKTSKENLYFRNGAPAHVSGRPRKETTKGRGVRTRRRGNRHSNI